MKTVLKPKVKAKTKPPDQDKMTHDFYDALIRCKEQVTIYFTDGSEMLAFLMDHDRYNLLFDSDGFDCLVMKHAVKYLEIERSQWDKSQNAK